MAAKTTAASCTDRVNGPGVSKVGLSGTMPRVDQRPAVVLSPTCPVTLAGMRTEPPVSVPMAMTAEPSAQAHPGAGAGAAAHPVGRRVPGIARCLPVGGQADGAEGELHRKGLAHDHRESVAERRDHRSFRAPLAGQLLGRAGEGGHAGDAVDVLDGNRQAH